MKAASFLFLLATLSGCDQLWSGFTRNADLANPSASGDMQSIPPSTADGGPTTAMDMAPTDHDESNLNFGALNSVWGLTDQDAVAVGKNGLILRRDTLGVWQKQTNTDSHDLHGVFGIPNKNVWAVGTNGFILTGNSATVSIGVSMQVSPTSANLNAIWGSDPNNLWAVGGDPIGPGVILKYNGSLWIVQRMDVPYGLNSVWGSDANNVWAVGGHGVIIVTTNGGSTWAQQTGPSGNDLYSVWGFSSTQIWTVGAVGTLQKSDGKIWTAVTTNLGASVTITGITGRDPNTELVLVSSGGLVGRLTAATDNFSTLFQRPAKSFNAVSGAAGGPFWAVGTVVPGGTAGAILYYR